MRRPLLVAALVAAVIALVVSAAVAVGALGGPSSGPTMMRGDGQSRGPGMMGQGQNRGSGMMGQGQGPGSEMMGGSMMGGALMGSAGGMGMSWLPGNGVAVSGIPAARARAATTRHGTFIAMEDSWSPQQTTENRPRRDATSLTSSCWT